MTPQDLELVRWAALECDKQRSGELSVYGMVKATIYAMRTYERKGETHITVGFILALGALVEPTINRNGFRTSNVRVGPHKMAPWEEVPRLIEALIAHQADLTASEFYKEFEEIHPFRDGNGRVGKILWHYASGFLREPPYLTGPPNYWE